ncbi:Calcium-independent phospholipase A2-gamma [Madurella fahalii]|uniref:Calcium-independent phospholipase A2-gamma n=1 Tax=Madurella fahalii TaxID=1157608 RepID=A0ABQ0FZR5_9PEZI
MSYSNDEAMNLLSLDGGGVRGVASLLILHEIMVKIKELRGLDEVPKPCEFFHMIAGTSTGGLIAIMLGRLRMSTEEAIREYDSCAAKIFSSRNKKWTTATERFRATALREVIEDLVRRRNMGDELQVTAGHGTKGHCFVCAMPANQVGEPRRLRSFWTDTANGCDGGIKIWEAARATTAASFFFKPMPLRVTEHLTEDYIDAAIGCNNPVEYLLQEAADYLGTGRRLGCVISIGTGTRLVKLERASAGLRNLVQAPKYLKELLGTLKNTATDGEETHRRIQGKLGIYPNAYFRFNVSNAAAEVKLHEYLRIPHLKAMTAAYLSDPLVAARILTAAGVLERNSSEHGLTLGHIHRIDKAQVVLSTQEAQPLGSTTRFFTGRDDILAKMDIYFSPRNTGGKPRREFLLHGMGGVGKTQIALKTADDLEERFRYIFHVDGTDVLSATQSYAKICQEQRLGHGTNVEMKDLALQWIEALSDEWLIIYDNLPDSGRFQPTLPRRNKGNIIYTSQSQGFLAHLPPECVCEVMPMAETDAVDLLLKAAGREQPRTDAEEMEAARHLVAELGYLPLAIDGVAAYLREGGCSVLTCLQRFREERAARPKLLSKPNPDGSFPARPALYTALDLSYDAIVSVMRREGRSVEGRAAQGALQALNLLCFYHNESIPCAIIKRAAEERLEWGSHGSNPLGDPADGPAMDASPLLSFDLPSGKWNPVLFSLAVGLLRRFSLIKVFEGGNSLSMHVMVQAWAQDRMSEPTRRRQALAARMVLIESIIWSRWSKVETAWLRRLPSHVNACMAHDAAPITNDEYQGLLDFKLGWYYKEEKQFSKAVEHLTRALRLWKCVTAPNSRAATLVLGELGKVYHEMGRLTDAELTYRELIDRLHLRREEVSEEATAAHEEKMLSRQATRQKRAHLLRFRKSAEGTVENGKHNKMGKSSATSGQPCSVAISNVPPAWVGRSTEQLRRDFTAFVERGDMKETEQLWEFELATAGANLGFVLIDQGRSSNGRKCILRAIELMKEAYPDVPDFIDVFVLEDELKRRFEGGDLEYWAGRYRVVRSMPESQKDNHSMHDYAFVLPVGYADYLLREKAWDEAYDIYEKISGITESFYGAGGRRTLFLLRKMAFCQLMQGLFEDAEILARTAVSRAKASYGQWHFETAECLHILWAVRVVQVLDTDPDGELWNITEEAYDTARVALWEGHSTVVMLKEKLHNFRNRRIKETASSEAYGEPFHETAGAIQESKEACLERLTIEYRETNRKNMQVEFEKIKKRRNPGFRRLPGIAEGRSSSQLLDVQGEQGAVAETQSAETFRAKPKWKGKGKEIATPFPIPKAEPGFREEATEGLSDRAKVTKELEPPPGIEREGEREALPISVGGTESGPFERKIQGKHHGGVERRFLEALLEEPKEEKSKEAHPLRVETDPVSARKMLKKPRVRLWRTEGQGNDAMMTGALSGEGESSQRRIMIRIQLDDLVKPPTEPHVGKPIKLFA